MVRLPHASDLTMMTSTLAWGFFFHVLFELTYRCRENSSSFSTDSFKCKFLPADILVFPLRVSLLIDEFGKSYKDLKPQTFFEATKLFIYPLFFITFHSYKITFHFIHLSNQKQSTAILIVLISKMNQEIKDSNLLSYLWTQIINALQVCFNMMTFTVLQ